jgi:predicted Zn-dependent protease
MAPSCHTLPAPVDGGSVEINGFEVYWLQKDFPLQLFIDSKLPAMHIAATYEAAATWNSELGVKVFEPVVYDLSTPVPSTTGVVTVTMTELGKSENGNRILGLARLTAYRGSSRIRAVRLWFDTDLSDEVLLIVMTHELGHALTLEHDNDCTSIMHPTVVDCKDTVEIKDDDEARIKGMTRRTLVFDHPDANVQFIPEVWRQICTH